MTFDKEPIKLSEPFFAPLEEGEPELSEAEINEIIQGVLNEQAQAEDLSKGPELSPEAQKNFIRLGEAFEKGGSAGLRKEFDRLFPPDSPTPSAQPSKG